MRTIFIALCLLFVSCVHQTKKNTTETTLTTTNTTTKAGNDDNNTHLVISEDSVPGKTPLTTKDIGIINEGEIVEPELYIKNERKTPLVIFNATASCGCTSVSYKKEPIKSGETGKINVTYDSKGKSGQQTIFINLITDDGDYTIKITLFVKK